MKTEFSSEKEFIEAIAIYAQRACKRYGYLPSVLIAQACLENGYGMPQYWDNPEIKYLLLYNNMVGQKASLLNKTWYDKSVWPGKSFNKLTPEEYSGEFVIIRDNFRIFDDVEQSFCDFILFLLYASNIGYNQKPKYGTEVVNIKDPLKLITEVAGRGYASSLIYPSYVMKIINKHNLSKYDDLSKVEPSKYIPDALKDIYLPKKAAAAPHIELPNTPFKIQVTSDKMIYHAGPSYLYSVKGKTGKYIFTIVSTKDNWGKLKSGYWVDLSNINFYTIVKDKKYKQKFIYNNLDYSLVFDPVFYAEKYEDLRQAFGDNSNKLFNHFCTFGMRECRQANSSFNVIKYKAYYDDLRQAFEDDMPAYYKHYIEFGHKENRKTI